MQPLLQRADDGRRTGWLILLIFSVLAVGIVTAGYVVYQNFEQRYHSEMESQLSVIAELKVDELVRWRKERLSDGGLFVKNLTISALVRRFLEKPEDAGARRQIQTWIEKVQAADKYDRVRLLDTQGVTRLSIPDDQHPLSATVYQRIPEVLQSGQETFQDFYRDDHDQRIYLSVLVPLHDAADTNRPLGLIELRIDPGVYLYPFIRRWPTPSRTAETLLVRREGNEAVYLNQLRFQTNTALNLRAPLNRRTRPAAQAVLGREGIMEGIDYRNVPVVAALRTIPDSPWSLVARMDAAEVYAPLHERLWMVIVMVVILLFATEASVVLIWRQQHARLYKEKYWVSEALRQEQILMLALMQNVPAYIYFKDTASRFLRINPFLAKFFGVSDPAQVVGKTDADFLPAERARKALADEQEILRTGQPVVDIEEKTIRPTGSVSWELTTKLPLRDGLGQIVGTCGISSDITARKRAEEALERSARQLQEQNAEMEQFLYTASHDLKSPLVTVRTFLGYLEQDLPTADAGRIEKDLGFIRAAANKMARLLDELLEMSRIGRVVSPPVKVTVGTLVDDALDAVAGRISGRGVQVQVADRDVTLYGDRGRLGEVWQNLVDNACKFMGQQQAPRIEIGVEQRETETVFFVRDNGIGIDPRHRSKVFGLFEKLNPRAEGTGIGLAYVKRIVEFHDGRIWVESEGVGQGTCFYFTLPRAVDKSNEGEKL